MTQFAKRMDGITGSAIREIFKLLSRGDIISFGGGNPSASSFPADDIRAIADDLLAHRGAQILQYGPTEGYAPLRAGIAEKVLPPKGVFVDESRVLPLTGSIQGMDLLCRVFVNPGDTVLVESPTFLGALQTLKIYEANIVAVPCDAEGVSVERLEELMKLHRPKLFYCIPTFQNPSGKTIGVERRKRIAKLAEKYDVIVAEDDPYCDLRYSGEPLPAIKSYDEAGQVLLMNSFSKIISPGIRVGCITGAPDILRKLTIAKQGADTHTSNLSQAIVAEFLQRNMLPMQIARILPEYKRRLDAMLAAMDAHMPAECEYTRPEGGLFVWGEIKGLDMEALLLRATEEKKVAYIPGVHFFADREGVMGTFRLNFTGTAFENIEVGIKRLAELVNSELELRIQDPGFRIQ